MLEYFGVEGVWCRFWIQWPSSFDLRQCMYRNAAVVGEVGHLSVHCFDAFLSWGVGKFVDIWVFLIKPLLYCWLHCLPVFPWYFRWFVIAVVSVASAVMVSLSLSVAVPVVVYFPVPVVFSFVAIIPVSAPVGAGRWWVGIAVFLLVPVRVDGCRVDIPSIIVFLLWLLAVVSGVFGPFAPLGGDVVFFRMLVYVLMCIPMAIAFVIF
jgi:hypothetical protein